MRHNKQGRKFGRLAAHRKMLMRNLTAAIIERKRIRTTEAKAKEMRAVIEHLVTLGKSGTLHARREALKWLPQGKMDKDFSWKKGQTRQVTYSRRLLHELFHEIAPKFTETPGGYTRILKLGNRPGDNAPMALIELIGFNTLAEETPTKGKAAGKTRRGRRTKKKSESGASEQPVAKKAEASVEAEVEAPETEVVEESTVESSEAAESVVEEAAAEPVVEEPVAEEPATEALVEETPEVAEPVTEEPATEAPVEEAPAEEPKTEEPPAEESEEEKK